MRSGGCRANSRHPHPLAVTYETRRLRAPNIPMETTTQTCARIVRHLLAMRPTRSRHRRSHRATQRRSDPRGVTRQPASSSQQVQLSAWSSSTRSRHRPASIKAVVGPTQLFSGGNLSTRSSVTFPSPSSAGEVAREAHHSRCGALQAHFVSG
jgi:hypothetical protein